MSAGPAGPLPLRRRDFLLLLLALPLLPLGERPGPRLRIIPLDVDAIGEATLAG
ncbi:MAG: hypothetical protein JXX28_00155 [Deltaproteobacteria bacterium]|nr:hypothetical protein [Deltaproteobacteria bacterium]